MDYQITVKDIDQKKLYYYNNEWQKPVITEYQIFKLFNEQSTIPVDYFAFPWATMIDNIKNKKLYNFVSKYKIESTQCFTVMQHIYYFKYLDIIKQIGITHVFTPHKTINFLELEKKYGLKIISFSLYPAQSIENFSLNITNISSRKYLISFIGQYNPKCYISKIRNIIFDIYKNQSEYSDCLVKKRSEWHYECMVYGSSSSTNKTNEQEYSENLLDTKFSLCPSGSGPNSIRIWESMSYGTIPVILADTLVLPEICNLNWSDYFILWEESEIDKLYEYLKTIETSKLIELSNNCIRLYKDYFCPNKMNRIILEYFQVINN